MLLSEMHTAGRKVTLCEHGGARLPTSPRQESFRASLPGGAHAANSSWKLPSGGYGL